jgi:hypothetical protein
MAQHGGGVGKSRLAEFERVRARRETVNGVRSEVRREHEYVGVGASIKNIVRSAARLVGAAASDDRLTDESPSSTVGLTGGLMISAPPFPSLKSENVELVSTTSEILAM